MMRSTRAALALFIGGGLAIPAVVAAQAPITSVGLGYPVEPVDGRAAALGVTGVGLFGGTFSVRNPADLTEHEYPGFGLSFAGEAVDLEGGTNLSTSRQRFTSIRALVPFSGWAASIAFGGAFDQDWTVRFQDTLQLADGRVPFEESREQDGGISTIDLSLARSLGPVSLGVSAQRWNGSLRSTFTRRFSAPLDGAPALGNTGGGQDLSYRGWRFRGGASVRLGERLLLSGSLGLPGTLTADADTAGSAELDIPVSFEVGGSARLTDDLLVTAATGRSNWSDLETVRGASAHDASWIGGGVEYGGLTLLGAALPIRVGARRADLPFSPGETTLQEKAITAGFGWEFRQGLAAFELGAEFGRRGDFEVDGLEESFTRFTLSFKLRQTQP